MDSNTSNKIQIYEEIKMLNEDLFKAEQELKQANGRYEKEKLKDLINEIKLDLGWALLQCGEYEKGLTVYLSVFGEQYQERKYNGVGTALTELGRFDESKRVLEYGLRKFPKSCALWTDKGILYDHLGDYSKALRCFETAVLFSPGKNPGPLYNQALIMVKMEAYRDAASIIECLIEKFPEDARYLAERGFLSLEMGYPEEALRYLQKAMELYNKFPSVDTGITIFSGLCCAYQRLGMKREAMELAIEGLARFPDKDPVFYHNAGACFYEMGWIGEAKEVLQEGVEKFPNDEELKNFLRDVENDLDNPDGDTKPFLGLLILMALLHKKLRKK